MWKKPEGVFTIYTPSLKKRRIKCLKEEKKPRLSGFLLPRLAKRSAKYITKLIFQAHVPSSEEWDLNPW